MKLFIFTLLQIFCFTASPVYANVCSGSGFIRDSSDCSIYYQCSNGQLVKNSCPTGLAWNSQHNYCDWPANVDCKEAPGGGGGDDGHIQTTKAPATTKVPATTKAPTTKATTTKAPEDGGSGEALVSQSEFQLAAATKGGYPDRTYYTGFINSLVKAGITTRREALLFLAHATWETVGFIYTKEVYCQTNLADCLRAYPNEHGGLPGKVYYGRGMMQLTWDYNYKAASQYLYGDNRLITNPDVVGEDPAVGWATAAWYWFANVHSRSATFGSTLKAINGALECEGGSHGQNRYLRFMHYKQILEAVNEPTPSDDDGWCTAW